MEGKQDRFSIDFDAKRILGSEGSDFLGSEDINRIVLTKDCQMLNDMKTLDEVLEKQDGNICS